VQALSVKAHTVSACYKTFGEHVPSCVFRLESVQLVSNFRKRFAVSCQRIEPVTAGSQRSFVPSIRDNWRSVIIHLLTYELTLLVHEHTFCQISWTRGSRWGSWYC